MGSLPFISQDRQLRLFQGAAGNSHICWRSATPSYAQLSFGVSHLRGIWGSPRHFPCRASTSSRSRVRLKPSARVFGDVTYSHSTFVGFGSSAETLFFVKSGVYRPCARFSRKKCAWRAALSLAVSWHPFYGVGVDLHVQVVGVEVRVCQWISRHELTERL